MDRGRHRFPEEGFAFGRRGAPVLRAIGKQDNCRVTVSLWVATSNTSLPIAFQLYLPESWTNDKRPRRKAGVPEQVEFQAKPQITMTQIRWAVEEDVPRGVVLADAGYGNDGQFRAGLTELNLRYVVGAQSSTTVWAPGSEPLPAKRCEVTG